MKPSEIIKAIKQKHHLTSDYQVHKLTGWSRQSVSNFANNKVNLPDHAAIRAAEVLEIEPLEMLAQAHAERSKRSDVKQVWEAIAKQVSAAILLIFVGLSAPAPASANDFQFNNNIHYTHKRRKTSMLWDYLKELFNALFL